MTKTMKTASVVGGVFAALAVVALPLGAIAVTCNTTVSATVGLNLVCSGGSATVSSITPGQAGTATATVEVTTNSSGGFTVTYSTPPSLTSGNNSIAYSTSAAAGTQGWKAVASGSAGTWSSKNIANGVTWTSGYSATKVSDTITITVGTSTSTPSGSYSGTLAATCVGNS